MESLGLDIKLLIAQMINFGILLYLLSRFVYKPIMKILDERAKEIQEGIKNSGLIEKRLKNVEEKEKDILKKAQEKSKKDRELLMNEAKAEKQRIIDEAREAAQREIEKGIERINSYEKSRRESLKKEFLNDVVDEVYKKFREVKARPLLDEILKDE
jgi:F-type H+-transporting ATPase subunit b